MLPQMIDRSDMDLLEGFAVLPVALFRLDQGKVQRVPLKQFAGSEWKTESVHVKVANVRALRQGIIYVK